MKSLEEKKHRCITYSGTFDHLHIGHKKMITLAAEIADEVIIGITTQPMTVRKKLSALIQPYNVRLKEIEIFLREKNIENRVSLQPIEDKYGFALTHPDLDAILISSEAGPQKNAVAINEARQKQNLVPLTIVSSPFIKSGNAIRVSSYRIRADEMSPDGVEKKPDQTRKELIELVKHNLQLPEKLRDSLKTPFGRVFEG
jgi:pantetheine-phosphate adenylyltransferase